MFKAIYKILFSRLFSIGILIAVQVFWIVYFLDKLGNLAPYVSVIMRVLAIILAFFIIGDDIDAGFKITWIVIILAMPIFGTGVYVILGNNKRISRKIKNIRKIYASTRHLYQENIDYSTYEINNELVRKESSYLNQIGYTMYRKTNSTYFPSGETFRASLMAELEKAKSFIFMEYFIIKPGVFWDGILDILAKKAEEGLDVRVMYDDFGCALTVQRNYAKFLREKGIKAVVFNQLTPFFSTRLQNRDHRKICVIDGNIGYSGGINLGDEYINEEKRFGHWKDTAIKLVGAGVWSLTLMFLQNWNTHSNEDPDFEIYRPSPFIKEADKSDEYIIPYGDSPLDNETVGRNTYVNMINQADRYVYATTPYLILDQYTRDALILASKNGVDVRIITPGIFDKKIVSLLTRDNYRALLHAGVRIYEYTPGFIHAKTMVSDDMGCNVGTVNLDYRSFYHHFECGVMVFNSDTVGYVYNDFLETMKKSQEITLDSIDKQNIFNKLLVLFLRLLAPLM